MTTQSVAQIRHDIQHVKTKIEQRLSRVETQIKRINVEKFTIHQRKWENKFNTTLKEIEEEITMAQDQRQHNMTPRLPRVQPENFYGKIGEDVKEYLRDYNRVGDVNCWLEEDKMRLLPMYLKGNAIKFYNIIETTEGFEDNNWDDLQKALIREFQIEKDDEDRLQDLVIRKLGLNESIGTYVAEKLRLCRLYHPDMSEANQIKYIIKGLPLTLW